METLIEFENSLVTMELKLKAIVRFILILNFIVSGLLKFRFSSSYHTQNSRQADGEKGGRTASGSPSLPLSL